jgi:uncharacterized protein (UPF0332 family)
MVLDAAIWFEKAQLARHLARSAMDSGNLPGAANRAYYCLFAQLTGLLIQLGYEPPPERGNWPHSTLPVVAKSGFRASFQRNLPLSLLDKLRHYRVQGDYGNHQVIDAEALEGALRQLGTVLGSEWRGR